MPDLPWCRDLEPRSLICGRAVGVLARRLQKLRDIVGDGVPIIVGADFNASRRMPFLMEAMKGAGMTIPHRDLRVDVGLDFFAVSAGLGARVTDVCVDWGVQVSDHYPVFLTVDGEKRVGGHGAPPKADDEMREAGEGGDGGGDALDEDEAGDGMVATGAAAPEAVDTPPEA